MGKMTKAPIAKPRGLLAPTLCFCNELKAIMDIVERETAEKLNAAITADIIKPKIRVVKPAIALTIAIIVNSPMKTINARKSEAFK